MRSEFWETQPAYGGSPEIWIALKTAIENKEMRQAILESADIKLPQGTWYEVYDLTGFKYELPAYVLSDPTNLAKESRRPVSAGTVSSGMSAAEISVVTHMNPASGGTHTGIPVDLHTAGSHF
jgi:hypothetical protein